MIIVIGKIHAREGSEDAVAAAGKRIVAQACGEPGLIEYSFHVDTADPRAFVFIEVWENEAQLAEHAATQHLADFRAAAYPLLDGLNVRTYTGEPRSSRSS